MSKEHEQQQHSRVGRPRRWLTDGTTLMHHKAQTSASIKSTSLPLKSVEDGMNRETCPG